MSTRIMVFNDANDILELYRTLLEAAGYAVALQRMPLANLRDLERFSPDLILLDWMAGGAGRGLHLLRALRARPTTMIIPVIICTAAVQAIHPYEASLRAQGVPVIYKPFHLGDLLAAITVQLNQAHAPPTSPTRAPAG